MPTAPQENSFKLSDLLALFKSPFGTVLKWGAKSLPKVIARFTETEEIAAARAAKIRSEANVYNAKAAEIRKTSDAAASLTKARAAAIENESRLKLLSVLTASGILCRRNLTTTEY